MTQGVVWRSLTLISPKLQLPPTPKMKDGKSLALTKEGQASLSLGPKRPSKRAPKATCGDPTPSRPPPPPQSRARSKVCCFPSLSGPRVQVSNEWGRQDAPGGGGEVIAP